MPDRSEPACLGCIQLVQDEMRASYRSLELYYYIRSCCHGHSQVG